MAINREPILKRCRYLGISPAVMGISKESNRNPNANKRKKVSEYGMQLKEKQKLKFIYGVLEKPFYHYFEIAEKMEGKAGENLITILESRLDNVVFRMGMALTRRESRQLVSHGHFMVNGQKVDIPSYRVKVGDVIELCEKSKKSDKFKDVAEAVSYTHLTGVIAGGPVRAVIEMAGIKDIRTKSLRSNNPCNVVRATINGLMSCSTAKEVAAKRGKSIKEILG